MIRQYLKKIFSMEVYFKSQLISISRKKISMIYMLCYIINYSHLFFKVQSSIYLNLFQNKNYCNFFINALLESFSSFDKVR